MTEDDKKSLYWTGGTIAALVVLVAALGMAGVFSAPAVQ